MYDSRTIYDYCRYSFFHFRSALCLALLLCSFSGRSLAQTAGSSSGDLPPLVPPFQPFTPSAQAASDPSNIGSDVTHIPFVPTTSSGTPTFNPYSPVFGNGTGPQPTGGSGSSSGGNVTVSSFIVSGTGSVTQNVQVPVRFKNIATVPLYISPFSSQLGILVQPGATVLGQSFPMSSSSAVVSSTSPTATLNYNATYNPTYNVRNSSGTVLYSFPASFTPSASSSVTFSQTSPASSPVATSDYLVTFDATAGSLSSTTPPSPDSPVQPPNTTIGELLMLLNNETDQDQVVRWGNRDITLKPGVNEFRYTGAIDSNGFPSVRPSDFQGTAFSHNGRNYVMAGIQFGVNQQGEVGAIRFAPPYAPPGSSSSPPKINLLTPSGPSNGPTYGILKPDGTTHVFTPATPPTGGSPPSVVPVISNPTYPNPSPSGSNIVYNTTNNYINNTHNKVVNTDLDGQDSKDGIPQEPPQGSPGASFGVGNLSQDPQGKPSADLAGTLTSARTSFQSRIQNVRLLSTGGIPQITTYNMSLNLGNFGSVNRVIDFNESPFPQIRLAILVMITFVIGNAFFKRLTI
jgi:hypothetical protein